LTKCATNTASKSATVIASSDRRLFCQLRQLTALPASEQTVADYPAWLADNEIKAATIARRLVVISQAHRAHDLDSPTTSSLVRRTHAGIRRTIGTTQQGKAPALVADLKRMLLKRPARVSGCATGHCCCSASPVGFGRWTGSSACSRDGSPTRPWPA
jgi:hypothetical protein